MGIQIEDGKGTGIFAEVNKENLFRVQSESGTVSGHISNDDGNTFSVIGTATVVSGIAVVLHIINNDPSLIFALDRALVQGVTISSTSVAIPNENSFFSLGYNRTVTSGGTALTPITLNRASVSVANVTATGSNPNMTGTFVESHRWYIQSNGQAFEIIRPEVDDILLGRTNTMEIRYTTNSSSTGTVVSVVKFIMARESELP